MKDAPNADYILRSPRNDDEWQAYHAIRRTVLFENRGQRSSYIENHPDEFKPNNHPLVLVQCGAILGVIRVDIDGPVAWFRRVAIREGKRESGHGRGLLELAEAFASREGCLEVLCNVARDAVGFYVRCGYSKDTPTGGQVDSVLMRKELP